MAGRRGRAAAASEAGAREVDLYALLNVARTATREEIKAAYTKLARLLHPDKANRRRQAAAAAADAASDGEAANGEERTTTLPWSESAAAEEALEAQELFIAVDRAYKVLSNDATRMVYDAFGHEGLHALEALDEDRKKEMRKVAKEAAMPSTTLSFVDERGEALREKILGRVQLERELAAMARFNTRGAVQVNVDGKGLIGQIFEPLSEYDMYDLDESGLRLRFEAPQVKGVVVQQSVDAALSKTDTITLGAQVLTRGGAGMHSVTVGHEHKFSESASSEVSLTTSLRDPFGATIKGNRVLDQYTRGSLEFVVREHGSTGLNVQAARKLSETVNGVLQVGFGIESGILVQLNRSKRFGAKRFKSKQEQEREFDEAFHASPEDTQETNFDSHRHASSTQNAWKAQRQEEHDDAAARSFNTYFSNATAMLFMSQHGMGVQTSWARSVTRKSSAKIALRLNMNNPEIEFTSSRMLSAHSKGNVALTLGMNGVRVTLRYDRGGVRYVVPIYLTSGLSFGGAILGGFIPSFVNYLVSGVLQPYYTRRQGRLRFENASKLLEARRKARAQLGVMEQAAVERSKAAAAKNGLVILRARYGARLHEPCDWREVEAPAVEDYVTESVARPRLPSDWDQDDADDDDDEAAVDSRSDTNEEAEAGTAEDQDGLYKQHPPNIDVTNQLSYFGADLELELHGGTSKSQLLGFYNPCAGMAGVEPQLYVRYKLASWVFEATFDDTEPVVLPSPKATLIGNTLSQPAAVFTAR